MSARVKYVFQEALIGLRRNLLMTVSVILSVVVSMALFGGAYLMTKQVDRLNARFLEQIDTQIYLCDGRSCPEITEEQRLALQEELESEPHVVSVIYISKEDAYQRFVELFGDQEELIATVTPEALPAAFEVALDDPTNFPLILDKYSAWPGVEEVFDQREIVDVIQTVGLVFQVGALVVAVVQLVAAGVLVTMTIQVTAFARRDQTAIMKLVGASNWYIGMPFMLEAMLACLFGALIAWGLLFAFVPVGTGLVTDAIDWVPVVGSTEVFSAGFIIIGLSIGVAALSSTIALYRHADV